MVATKYDTNKNKKPKPIEIKVSIIEIMESIALFCSFLIYNLSSSFN
jgi:hypothetical protein